MEIQMTSQARVQFVVRSDGSIDVFRDAQLAVTLPRDTLPHLLLDAARALSQPRQRAVRKAAEQPA